jgi:YlmC/YmxH family sporulation protein
MRFCELQQKEVINIKDGKCLGNVRDLEFDEKDGGITAVIVPGPAKWLGCVGREHELCIPWCRIIRIGPDIVLVDVEEKEVKRKIT